MAKRKASDDAAGAEAAYERFLTAALALPEHQLVAFRSADPMLARTNVTRGVEAIARERARIEEHLPKINLSDLESLPALALAVIRAAQKAAPAPSSGELGRDLANGYALRASLLAIADGLSAVSLLPAAEVERIKRGTGAIDAASDLVDLSALFERHAKRIAGKHAATPEMLTESARLGSKLVSTLRSTRAKRGSRKNDEAVVARDRLWSLLVLRHKDLRRVAYYIWDDAFSDHVPPLLSHKGTAR
jgi:hypothetical protein